MTIIFVMVEKSDSSKALHRAYRAYITEQIAPKSARSAAGIVLFLDAIGVPIDYLARPDLFLWYLFCFRIPIALITIIGYFWTSYSYPMASIAAVLIAEAITFLGYIWADGGVTSPMTAGLPIFFCAIPVLVPLTARQVAAISGLTFGGYLLIAAFHPTTVTVPVILAQAFFPFMGGGVAIASAAILERIRFDDFIKRTELEAARDELAELDQAKSRFNSNIHHELRTPLTLILAPLDSMRSGDAGELSSEVKRTLEMMYSNGQRLYKMINNLLDLSKVESGQLEVHRSPLDLDPMLSTLVRDAQALAERKGIALRVEGVDGLPEINADRDALEKIFTNLIGNALKFTDKGDSITVRGEEQDDGVLLRVIDTGIGIPQDKLGSIFDRFAQVDGSATRRHEGTGIGLSLAQELVLLHGGRIWAESEGEGHGTTMCVLLPFGELDGVADEEFMRTDSGDALGVKNSIVAMAADLQLDSEAEMDAADAADSSNAFESINRTPDEVLPYDEATDLSEGTPQVLIAEDNPDMRRLLASVIGKEFRPRLARNGREALEMAREEMPDLILSDVMMPEMSGLDLCRAVKEDAGLRSVPVVLVTSKAEQEMKVEGLEIGADDYVTKPFHPRELLARVRSLVRVRLLQRQLAVRNKALEDALRELKLAEAHLVQSERLSAVGELAAEIAHEVNNPVNFALNAARALQSVVRELGELSTLVDGLDAKDLARLEEQVQEFQQQRESLGVDELMETFEELTGIVCDGLNRTHGLVGDLRDFAAPEKREGERVSVDVGRGIRSTLQLVKHTLSEANARVECELEPDLPEISADPAALNQVFLNLVKNSAEAFEGEPGLIRIVASLVGEEIQVTVSDDGPGIPAEILEHLFEPFFTTKEAGVGTGLGLAISRRIVTSHGGTLEVESREGEGSEFRISLPLDGGESMPQAPLRPADVGQLNPS